MARPRIIDTGLANRPADKTKSV